MQMSCSDYARVHGDTEAIQCPSWSSLELAAMLERWVDSKKVAECKEDGRLMFSAVYSCQHSRPGNEVNPRKRSSLGVSDTRESVPDIEQTPLSSEKQNEDFQEERPASLGNANQGSFVHEIIEPSNKAPRQ